MSNPIIEEFLPWAETLGFILALIAFIYSRLVSWRDYDKRTKSLEDKFEVFVKDFKQYVETCESCRSEIRNHHESSEKHVTPALMQIIQGIAADVKTIQAALIGGSRKERS